MQKHSPPGVTTVKILGPSLHPDRVGLDLLGYHALSPSLSLSLMILDMKISGEDLHKDRELGCPDID